MDDKDVKKILKKFKNGAPIKTQEELNVLCRYASTGMVNLGKFNFKTREPEATLTEQGKWFVKQL